ncbi:MAG: ABC transporter permease [Candidatus Acidiferrales bacterium]
MRLVVALLALISGGAVVSALMNLDLDINHKLTQEFRSLGANLVISPPQTASAAPGAPPLMDESVLQNVEQDTARQSQAAGTIASPDLYLVAGVGPKNEQNVVVTGTWLDRTSQMEPWWKIDGTGDLPRTDLSRCLIGRNVSRNLSLSAGSNLALSYQGRTVNLAVAGIADAGGSEDNQIFVNLPVAQKLAGLNGKIQLIQLDIPGSAEQIRGVANKLQTAFPALEVKPIPQITEAEGKLLQRIRFLIFSMGLLILVLTALCVLATMAALAMERRRDVGLMKALGGSIQKVVGLFLTEVGVLGTVGGILGYALGMGLSIWMGHRVFGASISPRWEVLPATVILMLGVALAGALPLRLLGNVRPAVILRGE